MTQAMQLFREIGASLRDGLGYRHSPFVKGMFQQIYRPIQMYKVILLYIAKMHAQKHNFKGKIQGMGDLPNSPPTWLLQFVYCLCTPCTFYSRQRPRFLVSH